LLNKLKNSLVIHDLTIASIAKVNNWQKSIDITKSADPSKFTFTQQKCICSLLSA